MPSLLAIAYGVSHGWIAVRGWPRRSPYLAVAAAGAVGAVHFMHVSAATTIDSMITFVALVSLATLVEAIGDCRLPDDSRRAGIESA